MSEVWLRANTRVYWVAMVFPGLAALGGVALIATLFFGAGGGPWGAVGGLLLAAAVISAVALVQRIRRPRLAYEDGSLLLYLRRGAPVRTPITVVEAFLLGHAPSLLPGERNAERATTTVVIRIAESADAWARVEVDRSLGAWCDGYVTLRGTWCEPLTVTVVSRLNQRLAEVRSPAGARPTS